MEREKRLNDDLSKGKIEVAASKAERAEHSELGALKQENKKKQRKRDGPSAFYYEDDNRIELDYVMI